MVDRRVWWGAGVLIAGISATALAGAATAYADDSADTAKTSSSQTATDGPHTAALKQHSDSAPDVSALDQSVAHPADVAQSRVSQHGSVKLKQRVTLKTPPAPDTPVTAATKRLRPTLKPQTANPADPAATDTSANAITPAATSVSPRKPAAAPAVPSPAAVDATTPTFEPLTAGTTPLQSPAATPLVAITSTAPPEPIVIQAPPTLGPIASAVLNILSSFGWKPQPLVVSLFPALEPWAGVPVPTPIPAVSAPTDSPPTTAPAVLIGHSTLEIPCGPGYTARVDWYFPAQADGTVNPQGVIWLQHGFLANSSFYPALATDLASQTNSIVAVPTLTSNPLACAGCWLNGDSMQQAAATLFLGDRTALNDSAAAAGFVGTLPQNFILAGHSAGGGFAAAVADYTIDNGAAVAADGTNLLRGVLMFDGVPANGVIATVVPKLDSLGIPIYQIAAQNQLWNAFGSGTNQLLAANPNTFDGVVLVHGSHVDSMLGGNPFVDFFAQLITKFSPPGNTQAVYTFANGWLNDMYAGDQASGLYPGPDVQVQIGKATAVGLPAPWAQLAPIQKLSNAISSFFENLFGFFTGGSSAAAA